MSPAVAAIAIMQLTSAFGIVRHLQSLVAGPAGVAMLVAAVTQYLGHVVQEPLSAALRPLLNSYPQMLQKAAHSGGALGSASALYAEFQHQVQQVGSIL